MAQPLRVFGAGVRARVLADICAWQFSGEYFIEGYYDDRRGLGSTGPGNAPVLGTVAEGIKTMLGDGGAAFIALGTRASARGCEVFHALREGGVALPSFLSPDAHIYPSAVLGDNALVLPGACISSGVVAGHMLSAPWGSVIEHDSVVGHNLLLGPGVAIASEVRIGNHVFLGAGVCVVPRVSIGDATLVGAGAAVTRDIEAHVVAVGVPARVLRPVGPDDEVPTEQEVRRLEELGFHTPPGQDAPRT